MTNGHHRHLQETELFTMTAATATTPTTIDTSSLKCKHSDSKLQLQLETVNGDIIPFFCAWAPQVGPFSCTKTGLLASHCPKTCGACSKYRCADSEGNFIWKGEVRTCAWLAEKKPRNRKKLCKNKPKLATTCRATCNMCGVAPTSHPNEMPSMIPTSAGPSNNPSSIPSFLPSFEPSVTPSGGPTTSSNNPVMEWKQIGQDIDGENAGDYSGGRSGVSLSDDGNTVAIGSELNDGNGNNAVHVRVYQYDSASGKWSQLGQDIDGENAGDYSGGRSGVSLSDDGNTVAIGSELNDGNGNNAVHVRVYQYDSASGKWSQLGQDIDGENAGDYSGGSVSLSDDGNIVAIGSEQNDGNGNYAGHVCVYKYDSASGNWTQLGQDIDGENAGDYSGSSVSLSENGNTVAIGAVGNNGNGIVAGHVRVYKYDSASGKWSQLGQDIDGENDYDFSGGSVSLSDDGNTVAIGAPNNDGNGYNAGHVRVYQYDSAAGNWTQVGQDIDGENVCDQSGWGVSLSDNGNTVAIAAQYNDENGNDAGHVCIYRGT